MRFATITKVSNSHFRCSNPLNQLMSSQKHEVIKIPPMAMRLKAINVKKAAKVIQSSIKYLIKHKCKKIILGCTELPIAIFAFKSIKTAKTSKIFLDPNLILATSAVKKYNK